MRSGKLKLAALSMIGAYPTITLLLYALGPIIEPLPLWARPLVLVPPMVLLLTYVVMPTVFAVADWLTTAGRPSKSQTGRADLVGAAGPDAGRP